MNDRVVFLHLTSVSIVLFLIAGACGGSENVPPTSTAAPGSTPTTVVTRPAATPTPQPPATAIPTATATAASLPPTAPPRPTATPAAPSVAVGRLRVAVSGFENADVRPSFGRFGTTGTYLSAMYDWLVWGHPDGSLAAGVAQRWEMAADASSWTITVREGMKFQNGDALTAEDVKFSYDRILEDFPDPLHSTNSPLWVANVASVDVVSPTVVRINLKNPWPTWPYENSVRSGAEGAVVPKVYTQRVGVKGFVERPIGSGPWEVTRYETGQRFRFKASSLPHPYRESPKFTEMEMLAIPEESTRLAMVRTGAADLVEIGAYDAGLRFQRQGAMQLLIVPAATIGAVLIYGADDSRIKALPTGKREVREAMALAINTKELVDTLFGGLAQVAPRYQIGPGAVGWDPAWKPFDYNPTRAKELLAQSGYPTGFSVRVYSFQGAGQSWTQPMIEAVAGYWSNVGLRPQIVPTELAVVARMYRARPQATELIGQVSPLWAVARPNNLSGQRTQYHSKAVTLLLSRSEMDSLIDRAFAEIDPKKQAELVRQIEDLAFSQYVAMPIGLMPIVVGASNAIAGWKPLVGPGMGPMLETVTPR